MISANSPHCRLDLIAAGHAPHVCCRELPGCLPVAEDREACARLLKPWADDCDAHIVGGRLCIKVPLKDIFVAGYGERVIAAIRQLPCWLQRTLTWPGSVCAFVANGDFSGARRHLTNGHRGRPASAKACEASGVYAKVFLQDDEMAGAYLAKAESRGLAPAVAVDRAALYDDAVSARRCLQRARMRNEWPDRRCYIDWAYAWASLKGGNEAVRRNLIAAEESDDDCGQLGIFKLAMAWVDLLGDSERALACAERGMADTGESLHDALLFWRYMPNGSEMARKCLNQKGMATTIQGRVAHAEEIVMRYPREDSEMHGWAKSMVLRAVSRPNCPLDLLGWAAGRYAALFGAGSERILARGAGLVRETADALWLAEGWMEQVHLDLEARRMECGKLLAVSESLADNPLDYCFCAEAWKRLLGDHAAAGKCLSLAAEYDLDAEDRSLCNDIWNRLGRPHTVRDPGDEGDNPGRN